MAEPEQRLERLLATAKAALSVEASDTVRGRIDERLQRLAAELALEWIVSERRFENQSQQTEYWLARLYEELFVDEQPDAGRIYARFTLPLPRAQYLTRLLLARRSTQWRAAARQEVQNTLTASEAKAEQAKRDGRADTQRFELNLTRGGYDQLVVLYDFVVAGIAGGSRPAPPKRMPSSATLVFFSITAETLLAILKHLKEHRP